MAKILETEVSSQYDLQSDSSITNESPNPNQIVRKSVIPAQPYSQNDEPED